MKNKSRLIMAILAVATGLYFIFIAPGQINDTSDVLMLKQTNQGAEWSAGPLSRLYIGTLWMGTLIMAGVTLVVSAYPLYQGKKWAWPVSLVAMAIAPVGAFFIGLGYFEKFGMPTVYTVFGLGLVAFWAMLLLQENSRKVKVVLFTIITLVGMIGAQAFTLFPHSIRLIVNSPKAAISDPTVMVLRSSGAVMFIVVFLCLAAIYLLSQRKEAGWWITLISAISVAIVSFPVHYLRPTASLVPKDTFDASIFTSTYWIMGAQCVILVVLLLLPYFRNVLVSQSSEIDSNSSKNYTL
ncbi:MAG: hypothetical protein AB7V16_02530 [Vulcanibacillus sp.]